MFSEHSREMNRAASAAVVGCKRIVLGAMAAASLTLMGSNAQAAPDSVFLQGGAYDHVTAVDGGLTWTSDWSSHWGSSTWSIVTDASAGYWWLADSQRVDHSRFYRVGLTPALRLTGSGDWRWFIEAGVGLNVIMPEFHSRDRSFSTNFNFGDHLAIGARPFGDSSEWSLRVQHYSNANIRRPNPGQNFLQLRWRHFF